MMNLQRVEFVKSAAQAGAFLHDGLPQIAFAGKSNVGKSSVLNCVLQRKIFALQHAVQHGGFADV